MNRRGFISALAAIAVAPVAALGAPTIPRVMRFNDYDVLDVTRVDVFDRAEFNWHADGETDCVLEYIESR